MMLAVRYYYSNHMNMKWTEQIRKVEFLLMLAAVVFVAGSLIFTHYFTLALQREEHSRMEVWAEAMRSLSQADENTNLSLVLKVLNENNTIPVVVMDGNGNAQTYRNLTMRSCSRADSLRYASRLGQRLKARGRAIKIALAPNDFIYVCFDDSILLKRLVYYPWLQLGVLLVFIAILVFALLAAKRAEQNRVWVGLSKETAHQLGTPISSLMAWVEVLKSEYPDDNLIPELDKDIQRLQLVSDRFSKIGSTPELTPTDIVPLIERIAGYMQRRVSHSVNVLTSSTSPQAIANINANLFEWVVENLCKNAVDAMGGGPGTLTLRVFDFPDMVAIEVADTGKGIRKKDLRNVFKPGFTTKKRGWGLGLSLAKRIVEEYHKGRIWIKSSEVGKGTTFRIELRK